MNNPTPATPNTCVVDPLGSPRPLMESGQPNLGSPLANSTSGHNGQGFSPDLGSPEIPTVPRNSGSSGDLSELLGSDGQPGDYQLQGRRRTQITYANVSRFIGRHTLRHFLSYADLSVQNTNRVLRIFSGQEIHSFHIFLFPDLISPQQMSLWGVPYGVAAKIMLRAEGYYHHLVHCERMSLAEL
ncbi:uncharacterized protein MELLADRAFT_91111 [Melampsora larici-populina 98AG31]|uniref:Uncharacterized protein n=1 Tax=Melampsora larici-populina (strain 98AG31 / pathotype 3-4-7) TaxID=747676 RepID=F4R768_MELLP|nr:uncharacterized protein MELLADRAFT_91111 [Melampsora larici-populina 98AG31]EGG11537.1 hypothetical protein MELLADRAFT_91111 [Melampsora larici-populina 98AG31]